MRVGILKKILNGNGIFHKIALGNGIRPPLQDPQGSRIAAEHGVVKAKGSWVTLNNPAKKTHRVLPPPTQRLMSMLVCLLDQICRHSRTFLFLYELTDLSHCISLKAIVKVSYMRKHLFFNVEQLVSIFYILHIKNIIIVAFFARFFSVDPKSL